MNIQSVSVVVPNKSCINNCPYCVSRQHHEDYGYDAYLNSNNNLLADGYFNRLKFVRDNGCNTLMITGTSEPQQNMEFIKILLEENKRLAKPFYNIEIQTTGADMEFVDFETLAILGVTTIAFSISSFVETENEEIINGGTHRINLYKNIKIAKMLGMNVRACINLTSYFNSCDPEYYFFWAKHNDVDQITFRKIYTDERNCYQTKWIEEHPYKKNGLVDINGYVKAQGVVIAKLPYGFTQYSVNGISTVIDTDCMSKDNIEEMKYAVLRPNGHLYSRWDDKGSLIF